MKKFSFLLLICVLSVPLIAMEKSQEIIEKEKQALAGNGLAMFALAEHYNKQQNGVAALQWFMRFGIVAAQEATLLDQEADGSQVLDFNLKKIRNVIEQNDNLKMTLKTMQKTINGHLAVEALWLEQNVKSWQEPTWLIANFEGAESIKFIDNKCWDHNRQNSIKGFKKEIDQLKKTT
jgi:hypothetical protein